MLPQIGGVRQIPTWINGRFYSNPFYNLIGTYGKNIDFLNFGCCDYPAIALKNFKQSKLNPED